LGAVLSACFLGCAFNRSSHEPAAESQASEQSASLVKAQAPPLASPRQLIRTVTLVLDVESVASARRRAEALVHSVGGFVESLEQTHHGTSQQLELTLRVPREKLDPALASARKLGSLARESQRVEDVMRKYVDTDARLRNIQRTEQRLLPSMAASGAHLILRRSSRHGQRHHAACCHLQEATVPPRAIFELNVGPYQLLEIKEFPRHVNFRLRTAPAEYSGDRGIVSIGYDTTDAAWVGLEQVVDASDDAFEEAHYSRSGGDADEECIASECDEFIRSRTQVCNCS
jgi:hypothetical protein